MKKLFSFIAVLSLLLSSCDSLMGQMGSSDSLFSAEDLAKLDGFKASGGWVYLTFTPVFDWEASSNKTWISVSPESGTVGESVNLKITLDENTGAAREGKVFVSLNGGSTVTIPVRQLGGSGEEPEKPEDPVVELVDGGVYSIDGNGGYLNIKIRTNVDKVADVYIPSSVKSWLSQVETATRAMRTDVITLSATKNDTGKKRSADITVYYGNESVEFTVNQEPAQQNKPSISIAPSVCDVPATGGSVNIDVTSNTNWSVSCATSGVTINPASGNGNGSVKITLPATTTTRDVTVTFKATLNGETKEAYAKLTQTVSGNEGGNEGGNTSDLTPGEHQENLLNTGNRLLKYFNPDDTRALMVAITELGNAGGFDFYLESNDTRAAKNKAGKSHKLIKNIFTSVLGVARFSPTSAARLSTTLIIPDEDESYTLDDYKGNKYVFNYSTGAWKEYAGAHSGNKMTAVWGTSVATLTWEDGSDSWEGYVDYNYKAKLEGIPSKLNFKIAVDGETEFETEITVSVPTNYEIDTKTSITLKGGYAFSVVAKADRKGVEGSVVVAKAGEKIISGGGKVAINDLTDSKNWWTQYTDEWYDGYQWHYETWTDFNFEYPVDYVKTGEAYATILDISLQGAGNLRTVIDEGSKIDDTSTLDGATTLSNLINANASAAIYYTNGNTKIADVVAQPMAYEEYQYNWDTGREEKVIYYDPAPVLLFTDGSKFAVDEYFTEMAFGDLIDAAEALWESYAEIVE